MSLDEAFGATKVIKRLPQDHDELWWVIYALWGIKFPRTNVCPNHVAPFEALARAYFAEDAVAVWKASRGLGGKSFMLGTLSATEAVLLKAGVTILGGSSAQSLMVHRATDTAWKHHNAPKDLLKTSEGGKHTMYDTILTNTGWIRSLTASQTSVRGPHPQRLRLDEIDEMELSILDAAQGQPMRDPLKPGVDTNTVMSSTHQYANGTMTQILKRAKENKWPVFEWCYRDTANPVDGWLTMDEVERKRSEVTKAMWETEYELGEPSIEGRAIDTDLVEYAFKKRLGHKEGYPGEIIQFEDPPFDPSTRSPYATGIDWAKEKDWTVVVTFRTDVEPWRMVAFRRFQKMPWPVTIAKAEDQWLKFGGKLAHDATGVGGVVDDYLEGPRRGIKGLVMSTPVRNTIFNDYIAGIENQDMEFPFVEWMYLEHLYATNKDLFTTDGHPPDSFVAGAMAWTLRPRKRMSGMQLPQGVNKSSEWRAAG